MLYFLILLLAIITFLIRKILPIISGYGAKTLCSSVFVGGREPADVIKNELGFFPLSLGTYTVDLNDRSATAKVAGMAKKKAIYRKGLGATLINRVNEEEIRKQHFHTITPPGINQDAIDWPAGNRIKKIRPEGIKKQQLDAAVEEAFREPKNETRRTRAVIVLYDGEIVAERYAENFSMHSKFPGWSMAKSITNALAGILVKQDKLDPNAPTGIEAWKNDERKEITIKHLLQMSSGLSWWEYYFLPSDVTNMLYNENDMSGFAIKKRIKNKPGTRFNYSSGTTNILSHIIRKAIGDADYYHFPYRELFYRTSMLNTVMEVDAAATFVGSSYCFATARDWARFGLLYMNDGIWNGERILPEGWVNFTITPTKAQGKPAEARYGAQWWLNKNKTADRRSRKYPDVPEDCFMCQGHEGQYIWIIPSEKLVVVRLALEQGKSLDPNIFLPPIIRAFKK